MDSVVLCVACRRNHYWGEAGLNVDYCASVSVVSEINAVFTELHDDNAKKNRERFLVLYLPLSVFESVLKNPALGPTNS